ncbi:MAG: hypothetical protein ACFWTX_06915 [Acidaminococcus timonensis]|jgi:ABC-type phosphate transport system substrate-binding protein
MTVATIVNKDVAEKVKSLTKQQLTDIFTAKVTNWKEVGGPDEPITLVTRPKTSGTRALFAKYALGGAEEASKIYGTHGRPRDQHRKLGAVYEKEPAERRQRVHHGLKEGAVDDFSQRLFP